MRTYRFTITINLICGALLCVAGCAKKPVSDLGPTTEKVEKMAKLASLKVNIADVLEARLGSMKGAWLIKGDALITVDLGKAQIVNRNPEARAADIILPGPEVQSPRVDFDRTKTYDFTTGLLTKDKDQSIIRDQAMQNAQKLIEQAASSETNIKIAREQAENIIANFYQLVDWTVHVRWQDLNNQPLSTNTVLSNQALPARVP